MNIKGLDGRDYSWHPSNCQAVCEDRSSLHNKAKELLEQIFPYDKFTIVFVTKMFPTIY